VYPEKGTVSFSAGLHGWAFTLTVFAKMYAKKFGVEVDKMMERLWGDNFFDPATKKWTKKDTGTATCKRGFVQFIYEPIKVHACPDRCVLWHYFSLLEKEGFVTIFTQAMALCKRVRLDGSVATWLTGNTGREVCGGIDGSPVCVAANHRGLHERQQGEAVEDDHRPGHHRQVEVGREGPHGQGADEAHHADVAPRTRGAPRDDDLASAVTQDVRMPGPDTLAPRPFSQCSCQCFD
jgi:hypothetical protein